MLSAALNLRRVRCVGYVGALCAAALWTTTARAQETEPFRMRNLTPAVAIFGLPPWQLATVHRRFGLTTELANDYRMSQAGPDSLVMDGETWRTSLQFAGRINERWSYGVEVPYYRQSGGVLDHFIDTWHRLFNLPNGGRSQRPDNVLQFQFADRNGVFYALDTPRRGLGDVQLSAARRVGADGRYVLRGTLKLPTGEAGMLAGSGSSDAAVTLLRPQRALFRARPAGYFWGLGAMAVGDAQRIRYPQRHAVALAVLGGSWKPWLRTGLKAQLDFHSAFYGTPLRELGYASTQLTVGGWHDIGRHGELELAVGEDLRVGTAPDVVLHVGVHWQW